MMRTSEVEVGDLRAWTQSQFPSRRGRIFLVTRIFYREGKRADVLYEDGEVDDGWSVSAVKERTTLLSRAALGEQSSD